MLNRMVAILSLTMLGLMPSELAAKELSPEVQLLVPLMYVKYEQIDSSEERAKLVRGLNSYCRALNSVTPKNSPNEEAWLQGEMRGDFGRISRAMESSEWARMTAFNFSSDCIFATNLYAASLNNLSRSDSLITLSQSFLKHAKNIDSSGKRLSIDGRKYGLPLLTEITYSLLDMAKMEIFSYQLNSGK